MADMEVLAPGGHQHLVDKIKEQLAMKADASLASAVEKVVENQPTAVLSGTVLTASDAYAAPPLALTVDGRSTQGGTPTPDAPVPILSVDDLSLVAAGKNLFDIDKVIRTSENVTVSGTTITTVGTSRDIFTGTAGSSATVTDLAKVMHLPAGTYTISCGKVNTSVVSMKSVAVDGTVEELIHSAANTTSWVGTVTLDTASYITIRATNQTVTNLQIELGSTATAYEPYDGHTVPIDLQDNVLRSLPDGTKDTLALTYLRPSTREGWAWYSRELVQLLDVLDMGDLAWVVYSGTKYRANVTGKANGDYNAMSTAFSVTTAVVTSMADGTIRGTSLANLIYARNDACADAAAMKAACTGETLLYQLATPITHDLGEVELPVLPSPTCTVWSDPTTGLQMEYVQDTEIVIDSLYAEIDRAHAAIAPVEHGTSSANYAIGSYLMLDGTFCKVMSAIATGETIAIGTNVVATTVDAELASLA